MNQSQMLKQICSAIDADDLKEVSVLLEKDSTLLMSETVFGSLLHMAANRGKFDIVKFLVAQGSDVNAQGGISGGMPLNEAVDGGHENIVEFLLNNGAIMDVRVSEQNPLFTAIYHGYTGTARLLIARGIDTKIKYTGESMKDMDAIAFAREWGRDDIIKILESTP